ncbi:hypothetical protein VP01_1458g3 [Puccinia sorghi]|uniref:Uncharacterized protein n=1 Tax=Puccinia sorghi TaxID=27349 RepID=A0A0L6VLR5_9BASI|nr:hypothetical protein VP01_1458g3 [Puccinia sorghi]
MTRDVKDYVNSCYDCNRNKSSKHQKYGLLQPITWSGNHPVNLGAGLPWGPTKDLEESHPDLDLEGFPRLTMWRLKIAVVKLFHKMQRERLEFLPLRVLHFIHRADTSDPGSEDVEERECKESCSQKENAIWEGLESSYRKVVSDGKKWMI